MPKTRADARAFDANSFVRAHAPAANLSLSPAQTVGGMFSLVRTIQGNFASGPFDIEIHVPAGYLIFPHACGLVLTTAEAIGTLGQVQFGIPSDRDLYLAPTFVGITDAPAREEWLIRSEMLRRTPVSQLSAGLATAGLLTQALGYFFFTGLVIRR